MSALTSNPEFIQGSPEWLKLRKSKITATDAAVIMEISPWKTPLQLYNEKKSDEKPKPPTIPMQRGIDLEPIARNLFTLKTGINVSPDVIVKDWAMASLDGISPCGKHVVEIKCPGAKDHAVAVNGMIPDYYYPQLQHQMYVVNVQFVHYFSFDGIEGVIVTVSRDDAYIEKMVEKELEFYKCLQNDTPPDPIDKDFVQREDEIWQSCASEWKELNQILKDLEKRETMLRQRLIFLSGESNVKGAGISLCQVKRKGNIKYSGIPELKNIDLEKYRQPSSVSWRISCH